MNMMALEKHNCHGNCCQTGSDVIRSPEFYSYRYGNKFLAVVCGNCRHTCSKSYSSFTKHLRLGAGIDNIM